MQDRWMKLLILRAYIETTWNCDVRSPRLISQTFMPVSTIRRAPRSAVIHLRVGYSAFILRGELEQFRALPVDFT
jgi:hypothetical protein